MLKMLFEVNIQVDTFCEDGHDFNWGQKQIVSKPMVTEFDFKSTIEEQVKAAFDWTDTQHQCPKFMYGNQCDKKVRARSLVVVDSFPETCVLSFEERAGAHLHIP